MRAPPVGEVPPSAWRGSAPALTRVRASAAECAFDLGLIEDKSRTNRGQGELPPVNAAQCLIDTSALARPRRGDAEQYGWDQAAAAGLIATCPIAELEFFHTARSGADRAQASKTCA